MLLIKAEMGPSSIEGGGTGLFASEFIQKGTIVWKFDASVDEAYTKEEAEALPEPKRSEILSLYHSYVSTVTGNYIFPGDISKYMNHSSTPNIESISIEESPEKVGIALRDIAAGEELGVNYEGFAAEGANFETK